MNHTQNHTGKLLSTAAVLVSAQLFATTAFSGSARAAGFLNPFTLKPAVVVAPAAKFTMTPAPIVVAPSGGDSPQTDGGQPAVIPPNTSGNTGSTTTPPGTANAGTASTTPGSGGSFGGGGGFTTAPGMHPPGQS